jgi:hypothetical protein
MIIIVTGEKFQMLLGSLMLSINIDNVNLNFKLLEHLHS